MTHSVLAPSSAARWVVCPGSVTLSGQHPEPGDSQASREGTAAHWVASETLLGNPPPLVGTVAPNGVVVDPEMYEAAMDYARVVRRQAVYPILVERRVDVPRVHPECYGTPDCWAFDRERGQLHVFDFKYGHRFVDVFENWQLACYAAGIIDELGLGDEHVHITFHVVQPRAFYRGGPHRSWTLPASDLRGLVNILAVAAERALSPNPECVPNPECRDCSARHACPALQAAGYDTADYVRSAVPLELPAPAAGLELRYLKRASAILNARISGLEGQVEAKLRGGEIVPGWRMESVAGREKWKIPVAEVAAMGQTMGVDLTKPTDVITPAQARNAGLMPDLVDAYATRGSSTVLSESDCSSARAVFSVDAPSNNR